MLSGQEEGEPYRAVVVLFSGDLQARMCFADRADWIIRAPDVIEYLGNASLIEDDTPRA